METLTIAQQHLKDSAEKLFDYQNKLAQQVLIDFARFHVEKALHAAASNATLTDFAYEFMQEGASNAIDKESILSSYPLSNIQ